MRVHDVGLIENALFVQPLTVRRRETGCVRFSYLPPQSKTPKGYACVSAPAPVFMSRHFTAPNYARLALESPVAISAGGENNGELGAFYSARGGIKAANLRARLAEFVPPGANTEIRYVGER